MKTKMLVLLAVLVFIIGTAEELISTINFPDMPPVVIIQQPTGDYGFVSSAEYAVTEYNIPGGGNTIFLAHSFTETGRAILRLKIGDRVIIDKNYVVVRIYEFEAVKPTDGYSPMIYTETGETLSSSRALDMVFSNPEQVVFQTCIEKNYNPYWGRLFVVLEEELISNKFYWLLNPIQYLEY